MIIVKKFLKKSYIHFWIFAIKWMVGVFFELLLILLTSYNRCHFYPLRLSISQMKGHLERDSVFEKCDRADGFLTASHLQLLVNTGSQRWSLWIKKLVKYLEMKQNTFYPDVPINSDF